MRTEKEYRKILSLHKKGFNNSEIARKTGIPRGTVKDCVKSFNETGMFTPKYEKAYSDKIISFKDLKEKQKKAYAYILGQYLGDGHITKDSRKNVYRLRIFSDYKYPGLINDIEIDLAKIFPNNKVGSITKYYKGKPSCVTTFIYSKSLYTLFPQHGPGKKHEREIKLKRWQKQIINKYPEQFLKGLFHSDGCRYKSGAGYAYNFVNCSKDIINICSYYLGKLDIFHRINKKDSNSQVIVVARQAESAKLDKFIGAKS